MGIINIELYKLKYISTWQCWHTSIDHARHLINSHTCHYTGVTPHSSGEYHPLSIFHAIGTSVGFNIAWPNRSTSRRMSEPLNTQSSVNLITDQTMIERLRTIKGNYLIIAGDPSADTRLCSSFIGILKGLQVVRSPGWSDKLTGSGTANLSIQTCTSIFTDLDSINQNWTQLLRFIAVRILTQIL